MSDDTANTVVDYVPWYIGQLVLHLEGQLHFLPFEFYERLQAKTEELRSQHELAGDPPEEWDEAAKEFPAAVTLDEFLSLATPAMWALAEAMVEERAKAGVQ